MRHNRCSAGRTCRAKSDEARLHSQGGGRDCRKHLAVGCNLRLVLEPGQLAKRDVVGQVGRDLVQGLPSPRTLVSDACVEPCSRLLKRLALQNRLRGGKMCSAASANEERLPASRVCAPRSPRPRSC